MDQVFCTDRLHDNASATTMISARNKVPEKYLTHDNGIANGELTSNRTLAFCGRPDARLTNSFGAELSLKFTDVIDFYTRNVPIVKHCPAPGLHSQ